MTASVTRKSWRLHQRDDGKYDEMANTEDGSCLHPDVCDDMDENTARHVQ